MYPTNQYMDPYYSYCRDHPHYPYYPPPGWEADHTQMAMDSSCQRPSYGPLPYSGSASHSQLPESHSCCNKTYPPGYYSFRPPFPQELPPPHPYYHGPFPHHLNAYPSYFVPPPPYPVDQIPYGYGKFKAHCCGCPNHVCHGGEKSNLKIEEEIPEVKPDNEQKDAGNSSLIGHPGYRYPAMWLPSGNAKVKGRSFEMAPRLFSKLFPGSGEWTGDGKQQGHDNHNIRQCQWPLIWMPSHDGPKQETREFKEVDQRPEGVDQSPEVTKEAPHSPDVKIIPLSWFENDHNDQKPLAKDRSGEDNGRSSVTNQSAGAEHRHDTTVDRNIKTIPVVPGGPKNENKPAEKHCKAISVVPDEEGDEKKVRTCRTIPVMVGKKNDGKASNVEKEGENRKSNNVESSKAKTSKLPPVCLRVDPLPRKKSGNKSSGSLNPASKKVCEKESDMKEAQSKNQESQNKESNVPVEEKSSEVDNRMRSRNVTVQDASVKPVQEEQISAKVDQKAQPTISVEVQENASAGSLQECEGAENKFRDEASNSAREIKLSEPDAAVRIQSAYRGYDLRRWEPLEKLRKVKKVHAQMQDLKKQLQGVEASSKQLTAKEQVTINETIMNLLLNLDTIQGLHPSVREARKSVARELVCLQEKLDSLCKQLHSKPNQFSSETEQPERTDNAIQTTAHVSIAEAPEEAKFAQVVEESGTPSVNRSEMMNDEASSGTPKKFRQHAGSTEQKHEMKESSTPHDEGKAAAPGECQGTSSMDVMCDAALSGHSIEQKHHMEESNTMSTEESSKMEKATVNGERNEVSSVDCVQSSHDESLSEELSTVEQCPASTEHNSTEELSTGVSSPGATEDGRDGMATSFMRSGASVDEDGATEGQLWQSAASESSALNPDAAAATEDDQFTETSVQLEDTEIHEHDPLLALSEEGRDADMQNQVADTTQEESSAKEPDGTAEPEPTVGGTNGMDHVSTATAENSVLSPLPEEMPQCDSALQESGLQESEAVIKFDVPYKDDPAPVDQPNEARLENPVGDSKHEAASLENEARTQGLPSNMCAEPALLETVRDESPCVQDGTMLHENPTDSKMSPESRRHAQNSGDKMSRGTEAFEAAECGEMLEEASFCSTGPHHAKPLAENPKEDAGIQRASEEGAHGAVNSEEKNLADENLELKEMLQKLLSSGNDQMGIITELSEKVKTLERKVARKRRPKVRVPIAARNATANLH